MFRPRSRTAAPISRMPSRLAKNMKGRSHEDAQEKPQAQACEKQDETGGSLSAHPAAVRPVASRPHLVQGFYQMTSQPNITAFSALFAGLDFTVPE